MNITIPLIFAMCVGMFYLMGATNYRVHECKEKLDKLQQTLDSYRANPNN